MNEKDHDLDAAERALGTIPATGETPEERNRRAIWEERFAQIGLALDPVEPPPEVLDRVMAQINDPQLAASRDLERRIKFWRVAALTGLAASIALAAALLFQSYPSATNEARLFGVLSPSGDGAALIIEVDTIANTAALRPYQIDGARDGSMELWRVPEGESPVSLGLITAERKTAIPISAVRGDTLAVSLEPEGGSQTGQPSGEILYSGRLYDEP